MMEPNAMNPAALPWAPVYSTAYAGQPESTVFGVIYVWAEDHTLYANAGLSLLRVGDTRFPFWNYSLLRPFQFMALYPRLKKAYPTLSNQHYVLMMGSHQADTQHINILREIMDIGQLPKEILQVPPCPPKSMDHQPQPDALYHPDSGMHLAHLLYLKAEGQPLEDYLNPYQELYALQRELLNYLLNRNDLPESVDESGMPMYALNAVEAAQLYQALILPVSRDLIRQCPDELTDVLEHWNEVAPLMREYPELIGRKDSLDMRLMTGQGLVDANIPLIAMQDPHGLLCVGIGPNPSFKDGIGIFIKLASPGENPQRVLEPMVYALLNQLGLGQETASPDDGVLETAFHFDLQSVTQKA